MITNKQRAQLRAMANTLQDTLQVGKDGLTDGVRKQLDDQLEASELVKVKLLESSLLTPRGVADELCRALRAEPVQCIGSKVVLYRQAAEKDKRKIVLVR